MSEQLIVQNERYEKLQVVLMQGDLAKLNAEEKVDYYNRVCDSLSLNPLTKPFDYMVFQGKEKLYANKNCAEQLRARDKISIQVVTSEIKDDLYIVVVRAVSSDGRQDEDIAAIPIGTLKGLDKSNAIMKCMTKAKRRVTLSICGLGMLDETEVEDTPNMLKVVRVDGPKELEANKREEQSLPTPTLRSIVAKYIALYKLDKELERDRLLKVCEGTKDMSLEEADELLNKRFKGEFSEKITS